MKISLNKGDVNIDTVAFSIHHVGEQWSGNSDSQSSAQIGLRTWSKNKIEYIRFPGRDDRHAVIAMCDSSKGRIRIEGSPYAYRLGQNVHTGIDLNRACRLMLSRMMTTNRHAPDWLTVEAWDKAVLERVDVAVNFQFSSNEQVCRMLDQLGILFVLRRRMMQRTMTSLYWSPQRSKNYGIALYSKGDEMQFRRERMRTVSSFFEKIVRDCQGVLRIEVRLRKPELKELGLEKPSAWTLTTPRDVFCKYFKRLPIANLIQEPISHEDIARIGKKNIEFLVLYRCGIPITEFISQRTISRRVGELKKLGIDYRGVAISKKYARSADVLAVTPIAKPSQWLIKSGRVPLLRKKIDL